MSGIGRTILSFEDIASLNLKPVRLDQDAEGKVFLVCELQNVEPVHAAGSFDLGGRIQFRREKKGMSRTDLARVAGVDYDVLNKVERGQTRQPRGDFLVRVADALGTSPASLLFGGPA